MVDRRNSAPWAEILELLADVEPDQLRGRNRLGALAFEEAPRQLHEILELVRDLEHEDLDRVDRGFLRQVTQQLDEVRNVAEQMLGLSSTTGNAAEVAGQLQNQLQQVYNWFVTQVRPYTIRAQVARAVADANPATQEVVREIGEARQALRELQEREEALRAELDERADLIEAQRAVTGASGAAELSSEYAGRASEHHASWRRWLVTLVIALGATSIVGVLLLFVGRPSSDASTSQVASYVARDVLVIGLMLYAVRLAGLQFRVHRHLEAVAHDRAAALSTFSRLVSVASEPEVRASLATVLGQSVFASGESGFIDASGDHVTLVERVAAPIVHRLGPQ